MGEIADLEFENHGFLKNHVFLPTEQAGTNICSMVYQDINFKICLSLFGWKENILPKQHIVQCIAMEQQKSVLLGKIKRRIFPPLFVSVRGQPGRTGLKGSLSLFPYSMARRLR